MKKCIPKILVLLIPFVTLFSSCSDPEDEVLITSIQIIGRDTIQVGETVGWIAKALPEDAEEHNIVWYLEGDEQILRRNFSTSLRESELEEEMCIPNCSVVWWTGRKVGSVILQAVSNYVDSDGGRLVAEKEIHVIESITSIEVQAVDTIGVGC